MNTVEESSTTDQVKETLAQRLQNHGKLLDFEHIATNNFFNIDRGQ